MKGPFRLTGEGTTGIAGLGWLGRRLSSLYWRRKIWALIYYPIDTAAQDPTGHYPPAVADDHGFYFFRNRWRDADDVLISFAADTEHHGHAWDQPENLALNLMAYNTRFIGGPGKEREDRFYSSFLVDGRFNIDDAVKYTGNQEEFSVTPSGGYALPVRL